MAATTGFYRGDSDKAIGGPARVLFAPRSAPNVGRLSEIFNTSTYDLNSTYLWQEVGITAAPTRIGRQATTNEWSNEQFGLFRRKAVQWRGTIQSEAMEFKQANKVLLLEGRAANTGMPAGEFRTNYPAVNALLQYHIALAWKDDFGRIHAEVFPNCQWAGDNIEEQLSRADAAKIPISFTAFPDDSVVDPTTGFACYGYSLDQE